MCCVSYLGVTCILCITYYSFIYRARKAEQVCVSFYIKSKNVAWETVPPYPVHDKYHQVLTSTHKPFITMKVFPGPFYIGKNALPTVTHDWLCLWATVQFCSSVLLKLKTEMRLTIKWTLKWYPKWPAWLSLARSRPWALMFPGRLYTQMHFVLIKQCKSIQAVIKFLLPSTVEITERSAK